MKQCLHELLKMVFETQVVLRQQQVLVALGLPISLPVSSDVHPFFSELRPFKKLVTSDKTIIIYNFYTKKHP